MKKYIEVTIQFSIVLLQLAGNFLTKPDFFNVYQNSTAFLAGNCSSYIALVISITFLYLSIKFNQSKHIKFWLVGSFITCVCFCYVYYTYNKNIDKKTTLLEIGNDVDPLRIIKGDNYLPNVQMCADKLKTKDGVVNDLLVIQSCAEIKTPNQIDEVWPKNEILKNRDILLIYYILSLMFGCISLISGLQAIKCKRNQAI